MYLDHACDGVSLRELARRRGVHPSTVMRQVRRVERLRDDPLVDAALNRLAAAERQPPVWERETPAMSEMPRNMRPANPRSGDPAPLSPEGLRGLRRLAEPGAQLAVAPEMEKAMVLRSFPDGRQLRTAVIPTALAQSFVMKDWISCRGTGRVALYEMTAAGRAALRRLLAASEEEAAAAAPGLAEAMTPFGQQQREWGERVIPGEVGPRRLRVSLSESPVALLGRRRDKDGQPFLSHEQVAAAERLREDFELAQMGPRVAQNWDRFLTGGVRGGIQGAAGSDLPGSQSARERVAAALRELGPGLGDMVLRCCCYLEGVETAEKRLGWAARSGKVVLRIALDRLRRHYELVSGGKSRLIG
ncbi:helix-turn-helix domain-containing protein [Falsigemmobacter faecalis]|uniref:Helix-turn-helix domain-containing protein n=1 Tax=Falsigemmobacter faecalis TaxID=2488730 RepID=A0A3P3DRZ1_9RHOB|nr:helix-turn-helix domain-containing protein [Falsigemmobacter faecalis]